MHPGMLDRYITVQTFTTTQDATGAPVPTWTTLANVFANKRDLGVSERLASQRELSTLTTVWTIRHLSGLTAKNRIQYDSDIYEVIGVRERGRQEYLELTTEAKL